jgi:hypothetical protein
LASVNILMQKQQVIFPSIRISSAVVINSWWSLMYYFCWV